MQRFRRSEKPCAYCGKLFAPARGNARYCSDACRAAARRNRHKKTAKPAITAHKTVKKSDKPLENVDDPVNPDDKTLKTAIIRQITAFGLIDDWRAAEAVALADAMDKPDTGSAKAALSRQLTVLMDKLEALSHKQSDGVDEVMARAERLRKGKKA